MIRHMRAVLALGIALVAAGGAFASGEFEGPGWVVGSGNVVSEDRDVPAFDSIEVEGSGNVTIRQGPQAVTVEADDNALPIITTEVRGNVLHLGFRRGTHVSHLTTLEFTVSSPNVRGITISGSGNARTAAPVSGDTMALAIRGSGNIDADVGVGGLRVEIAGSGLVTVRGHTDRLSVTITGSGSVHARDCESAFADVHISGSGDAGVKATNTVDISISGSGSVLYGGGAKATVRSSGSGTAREY